MDMIKRFYMLSMLRVRIWFMDWTLWKVKNGYKQN